MSWHKVKVVAQEGTEFGILYDDKGELALIIKRPGEDWPHKLNPSGGQNQIGESCKAYIVITDDYAQHLFKDKNGNY